MFTLRYLILSLVVLIPSSSFFWSTYLVGQQKLGLLTVHEIKIAQQLRYIPVLLHELEQHEKYSLAWFEQASVLAPYHGEVAVELAHFYLQTKQSKQALRWLEIAVELEQPRAVNLLAKYYAETDQYLQAKQLLAQFLNHPQVLTLAIELAVEHGDSEAIIKLAPLLAAQPSLTTLYQQLLTFNIITVAENANKPLWSPSVMTPTCPHSIQFYATRLSDLEHITRLIEGFRAHALAEYFCFAPVAYIPKPVLACYHQGAEAIQCHEQNWPSWVTNTKSQYLGIMLPEGGANVHRKIVYLDSDDDIDVFRHELSHLLGFVDEYALRKGHLFCQAGSSESSLNVVVKERLYYGDRTKLRQQIINDLPWGEWIDDKTPIFTKQKVKEGNIDQQKAWLLGTPISHNKAVGVFPARTCSNNNVSAFKPTSKLTLLEYDDMPLPKLYLKLLNHHL